MPKPMVFVAGVAKCGTSSLFDALALHDDVYAPVVKEPHFHAFGGSRPSYNGPGDMHFCDSVVTSHQAYSELYRGSVGRLCIDASALTSVVSGGLERQKESCPDAKCILVVREPRRRALSAWMHLTRDRREDRSIGEALACEAERLASGFAPIWGYRLLSNYRAQVDQLDRIFGRDGRVVDIDRLFSPSSDELASLAAFLDLEVASWPDQVRAMSRSNTGGLSRYPRLYARMARAPKAAAAVRRYLPGPVSQGLVHLKARSLERPEGLLEQVPEMVSGLVRGDFREPTAVPSWVGA